MAGTQPTTSCRSLFKQLEIVTCLTPVYTFINELYYDSNIHLYKLLMQGISFIFTDQMPTYLLFKKVHSMQA